MSLFQKVALMPTKSISIGACRQACSSACHIPTEPPASQGKISAIRFIAVIAILLTLPGWPLCAHGAQTEVNSPRPAPVLICNLASVDQILKDVQQIFEMSGRPEMFQHLQDSLVRHAGNLKGVDRTRPFGMMLFLEPVLPPRPRAVVYVPISNEDDFINTLRLGPVPIQKTNNGEYEATIRNGRDQIAIRIQEDYCFLLPTGSTFLQDAAIPAPEAVTAEIPRRYDLAISADPGALPADIRKFLGNLVKAQFSAQLQRGDGESKAAWELRQAQGIRSQKWFEQFLHEGSQITFGVDTSDRSGHVRLEFSVEGQPGSPLARSLSSFAGEPSLFSPLLSENLPLQMALSWKMNDAEKRAALEYLQTLQPLLKRKLPEITESRLVTALEKTVRKGHIDAFAQFFHDRQGNLMTLAGLHVVDGGAVAAALREILEAAQMHNLHGHLQLDAHLVQDVRVHHFRSTDDDDDLIRLYGQPPEILLGAGSDVIWIAIGGEATWPALRETIETLDASKPASPTIQTAPLQIVLHAAPWLQYADPEQLESSWGKLVQKVLNADEDTFRLQIRPRESGVQLSMEVDKGYVRLFGALLAQTYDQEKK